MSRARTWMSVIAAASLFLGHSSPADEAVQPRPTHRTEMSTGAQAATTDELLAKYLAALDGLDVAEAKRVLTQAAQQAPGQPATELMQRHTRLLARLKAERKNSRQAPYTVVYPVGDLVLPIPNVVTATRQQDHAAPGKAASPAVQADFDSFIDLIVTTVSPKTWQQNGGQGTIACCNANVSLVVTQRKDVHEELVDLLEQLRRMQDLQVALEIRFITLDAGSSERSGVNLDALTLDRGKAGKLIDFAQRSRGANLLQVPKVTLLNGQIAAFSEPVEGHSVKSYQVQAVVSNDRRKIRLTLQGDGLRNEHLMPASVKDGCSLLVDLTPRPSAATAAKTTAAHEGRVLLLITPQILVQEEEEEKMGVGAPGP